MDPVAAEGFRRAADAYERGRPAYPLEAVTLARRSAADRSREPWSLSTRCGLPSPPICRPPSRSPARLKRYPLRPPPPTRSSRLRRSTGSMSPWPSPSSI